MVKTKKELISYSKINKNLPPEATIPTLFFDRAEKHKNKTIFSFFLEDTLKTLSWKDFKGLVNYYIDSLKLIGINKESKIAVLSENSPEVIALFIAIVSIGCYCCPIHNNKSTNQVDELINDYEYDIFVISELFYQKFKTLLKRNQKSLRYFRIKSYSDCLQRNDFECETKFDSTVSPDEIAYIMLSSGTTSSVNGICLTHDNILSNIRQVLSILPILSLEDKYFGMLPFSHSYGGLAELYQFLYLGSQYHFCRSNNLEDMLNEMKLVKPTVFQSVPRMWEKIHKNFTKYCCSNVIDYLGGNIKFGFSAGAFLNLEILKYFFEQGLPIYQGYGLTEASPSIAIAAPEYPFTLNSYKVLPEIELMFSEDSEILVKGPNILKSYYFQNPTVLRNGFLSTGDIAISPKDDYISIIGRKKDVIILSTAHKIVPNSIEDIINKHPLVKHSVLIGNNKPFITCLIFLQSGVANTTKEVLSSKDPNYLEIKKHITKVNQQLSSTEQIKKFLVFSSALEEHEMTISQKIIRKAVENNRSKFINQLYE